MKKFFDSVLFVVCMAICMPVLAGASAMTHVLALVVVLLALFVPKHMVTTRNWNVHTNGLVTITETNGALGGTLQTNDGIMGFVLTGNTGDAYALGTPILVTSLAALRTGGNAITATNNYFAYRQVSDFFNNAGSGAQLYLMLVPDSMTVADMADHTNSNGYIKLWNYAAGQCKGIMVMSDDTEVTVTTVTGVNADCYTALTRLHAGAVAAAAADKPFFGIVGGTSYSNVIGDVTNMASGTSDNYVSLLVGDIEGPTGYSGGTAACLGFVAGMLAKLPVQRKISRTANGPLSGVSEAYVGTDTVEAAGGDIAALANKGIITIQTYPNVSGYFFTGDPTCTVTSDDYNCIAHRRVINKAFALAYAFGVQLIDDEVPTVAGGTIDPGYAKWLQQQFINQIKNNMVSAGECSGVNCFVDPNQNILSNNTVNVVLQVLPVGYSTYINIMLGFEA